MNDFLSRMIQRHSGAMPTIQPRQPSRFAQEPVGLEIEEREAITRESHPTLVRQQEVSKLPSRVTQENSVIEAKADVPMPLVQLVLPRPERDEPQPQPMPGVASVQEVQRGEPAAFADPAAHIDTRPLHRHPRVQQMPAEQPHSASQREPLIEIHSVGIPEAGTQASAESPRAAQAPPPRLVPQREAEAIHAVRESSRALTPLISRTRLDRETGLALREVEEPPVQVTIGRIEVSALTAPPPPARKAPVRQSSMSLQDYLSRRQRKGT